MAKTQCIFQLDIELKQYIKDAAAERDVSMNYLVGCILGQALGWKGRSGKKPLILRRVDLSKIDQIIYLDKDEPEPTFIDPEPEEEIIENRTVEINPNMVEGIIKELQKGRKWSSLRDQLSGMEGFYNMPWVFDAYKKAIIEQDNTYTLPMFDDEAKEEIVNE